MSQRTAIPVIVDLMPRDPSAGPPYSPRFLIALALSTIPYKWWGKGRLVGEHDAPVENVMESLRKGGWKIVPMERADFISVESKGRK